MIREFVASMFILKMQADPPAREYRSNRKDKKGENNRAQHTRHTRVEVRLEIREADERREIRIDVRQQVRQQRVLARGLHESRPTRPGLHVADPIKHHEDQYARARTCQTPGWRRANF